MNKKNKVNKTKYRTVDVVIYPNAMGKSIEEIKNKITKVLQKHMSHIIKYSYILHDKDSYSEEQVLEKMLEAEKIGTNIAIEKGQTKPAHYHILLALKSPAYLLQIANWFGVSENMVHIVGGKDGYIDYVEYLIRENPSSEEMGKHKYSRDDVITNDESIWEEIDRRKNNREKYNKTLTLTEQIILEVRHDGLTLEQAEKKYPLQFAQLEDKIRKARAWFLKHNAEMPKERRNIHITGDARCGKTTLAKALARKLIDPDNNLTDDEVFHVVGADKVPFDNYDGQPVIIWDEWTATKFRKAFNRDTLKIFDPYPNKASYNIKYGSINLINKYNIVSCIQPFGDFADDLMSPYNIDGMHFDAEDKKQVYGRFPIYLNVELDKVELYSNGGDRVGQFDNYELELRIDANIRDLILKTQDNLALQQQIMDKIANNLIGRIEDILSYDVSVTEDDLQKIMSYGEIVFDKKKENEPLLLDEELPFE